jgi:serine/threonine-protein kinase
VHPLVPGFTITGEISSLGAVTTWAAVRKQDDRGFVLKVVRVSDATEAQRRATEDMALVHRVENQHVVRHHACLALSDGTIAMLFDDITGGSLATVVASRGPLSPGETVTTVAPLFGALANLHAVDVVHGTLTPASVCFGAEGRPLISDLGVARLLDRRVVATDGTSGFVAPELAGNATPSPASDVYALAALGWFCLTGAPPPTDAMRESLATLSPQTPSRLVEVITSCLSADPSSRPSAAAAAVEVFDAAPAESVRLTLDTDPAMEITRRIRAAAVAAPVRPLPSTRRPNRRVLLLAAMSLAAALAVGGGATWWMQRLPAASPVAQSRTTPPTPSASVAADQVVPAASTFPTEAPKIVPKPVEADVLTAPDSPRKAPTKVLQALVDTRAIAYVARNAALLDLVYAPEATRVSVDRGNIATALRNKATYIGLAFVVKDATFLDGTSDTTRIQATILTPAFETGQQDGRRVSHAKEIVGPSIFTLKLTPNGWRVLGLTAP